MARLLEAAPGLKYKAALSVAYGAGLRVSEVANLKVSDIPGSSPGTSERMMLRVEQGKGQRDRTVMLSPQLLELLRDWWRAARPPVWLFPGQNPINPITPRQLNRAVTAAKDLAGISKRISPHTLRHSPGLTLASTRGHAVDAGSLFALLRLRGRQVGLKTAPTRLTRTPSAIKTAPALHLLKEVGGTGNEEKRDRRTIQSEWAMPAPARRPSIRNFGSWDRP